MSDSARTPRHWERILFCRGRLNQRYKTLYIFAAPPRIFVVTPSLIPQLIPRNCKVAIARVARAAGKSLLEEHLSLECKWSAELSKSRQVNNNAVSRGPLVTANSWASEPAGDPRRGVFTFSPCADIFLWQRDKNARARARSDILAALYLQ